MAEFPNRADPALFRQLIALVVTKSALPRGIHKIDQALVADGAELELWVDEMIAGIQATVALNDCRASTSFLVYADAGITLDHFTQNLLECVDIDPTDIKGDPMIVNITKENTEPAGADGFGGDLDWTSFEMVEARGARVATAGKLEFDDGNKL